LIITEEPPLKKCNRCGQLIPGVAERCSQCLHADWLGETLGRMGEILRERPAVEIELCPDSKTRVKHMALLGVRPRIGFCGAKITATAKFRKPAPADRALPADICTFCRKNFLEAKSGSAKTIDDPGRPVG
jgi:hypothetical protein